MYSFGYITFLCFCFSLVRAIAVGKPYASKLHLTSTQAQHRQQRSSCQPFISTFSQSDVSRSFYTPFIGVSPADTYRATGDGLEMFLKRPQEVITTKGHVNSVVGEGATLNSTFTMLYGKVTFVVKGPSVAGVVTAVILIADGHDEIDVELVGGDPHHWQTNVYAPSSQDKQPLWGVYGEINDFHSHSSVSEYHNYTIDWTTERIVWYVDGNEIRTLRPNQTKINGTEHYPHQPSRIQIGIWDASSPEGTSEWAKGPINWDRAPSTISATVKSVRIECD